MKNLDGKLKKQNWEIEFKKLWSSIVEYDESAWRIESVVKIKSFIRTELNQQREEIVKEIDKLPEIHLLNGSETEINKRRVLEIIEKLK